MRLSTLFVYAGIGVVATGGALVYDRICGGNITKSLVTSPERTDADARREITVELRNRRTVITDSISHEERTLNCHPIHLDVKPRLNGWGERVGYRFTCMNGSDETLTTANGRVVPRVRVSLDL